MQVAWYRLDIALALLLTAVLFAHFSGVLGVLDHVVLVGISFVGVLPVLWRAYRAFRQGEWASMDLLASVALVFSLLSFEWVSAVFIELMLAAARILDDLTRDRTEKSIRGLLKLRPEEAEVERGGKLERVHLSKLAVGDIVVVDIGGRIPIDGVILAGEAAVDESSLTGESLPVDKKPGDRAFSSTLVQSGNLRIKTTRVGKDTTLERVIRLVESAREEKPTSQTLGERFGKFYLVSIFIGSAALFFITRNLPLVLSVVLVVCADDVAVAIPIAYLRAIRAAAGLGIIVKGSRHLEMLGTVRTIVFDKTGTLTKGALVVSTIGAPAGKEREVLAMAALAARRSTHPLSRAILAYAAKEGIPEQSPDSVEERGGKGVIAKRGADTAIMGKKALYDELSIVVPADIEAEAATHSDVGQSISYVAHNGSVVGFVAAEDQVKHNAAESIKALRALGVERVVMLTGDNERVAAFMAKRLGVDEWHAGLLPEGKVDILKELQAKEPVAMVGDGVNDAAALSVAGVGIAMGGLGTEGTIESAQIVLMRDDLATIPAAIQIARLARRISVEDFWIWGATNMAGLVLVFGGVLGPPGAAAYNFLSDFLPLFNSARVRVTVPKKRR